MAVTVVDVRVVRMHVYEWLVSMPMRVRRRVRQLWIGSRVSMPMMLVVYMSVLMLKRFMTVLMLVPLCEM